MSLKESLSEMELQRENRMKILNWARNMKIECSRQPISEGTTGQRLPFLEPLTETKQDQKDL